MSMRIRPYQPADQDAVRELIESVLIEFGFSLSIGGLERDLSELAVRYGSANAGFWVAESAGSPGFPGSPGSLIGTVAIRPKQDRTCELKRLYLSPQCRGRGLGQSLYAHAESFARGAGYDTIWLESSRRFGKAHRLYERNGFVLVAQLDNDWEDNVYEKSLK